MEKREGHSVTPRSGASVGMQGRIPAVNVINITRRPDGGIVNVEMKRQEGLSQEGSFHSAASAALLSRGTVPANVYGQPAYVTDQQPNMIPKQSPRKISPHMSTQLPSVDGRLDWSDQYQRLMIRPQRIPAAQSVAAHNNILTDQQRISQMSNHGIPAAVEQQLLHSHVNSAVLSQYAHALPASDVHFMSPSYSTASTTVPVPVRMEGTNGGVAYWAAQMGNDLSASGRVSAELKSANVTPQLISRLPGLQYDVIPPRSDGPSEAERKVAVLTQQLENEMRLTASQGSSLRQQATDTLSQYRSPPPYYGPHITANVRMATASSSPTSCVTTAVVDSSVSNMAAGDTGGHQTVSSLSGGTADVEQPHLSVRQGSDLDASTECYGKLFVSVVVLFCAVYIGPSVKIVCYTTVWSSTSEC